MASEARSGVRIPPGAPFPDAEHMRPALLAPPRRDSREVPLTGRRHRQPVERLGNPRACASLRIPTVAQAHSAFTVSPNRVFRSRRHCASSFGLFLRWVQSVEGDDTRASIIEACPSRVWMNGVAVFARRARRASAGDQGVSAGRGDARL